MSRLIVAYATRYGSTREVAERVGETLARSGGEVVVTPVGDVSTLSGFDAAVIAAPFYIGSLLKDAREFLERNRQALEHIPVALLTLGPISAEDDLNEARQQLDQALEKSPWLTPVAAEMFVGKYDPARLRFADKLLAKLPASPLYQAPARDDRDWDAIDAWSESLSHLLPV